MSDIRLLVLGSEDVIKPDGGRVEYRGPAYYFVPVDLAESWVGEGKAVDIDVADPVAYVKQLREEVQRAEFRKATGEQPATPVEE